MLPLAMVAMIALTIGLPVLLFYAIVTASGVDPSLFTGMVAGTVFATFLIATIFEIKRLADL
ncbi:hypothetical protein [Microvirga roseola]|uniref:hypothetical protein n=1 Tax=Microvirga roseola TaxID=2883126 RepID=UPI001E3B909E|nr:hypothetical protein [Microvirga roseola]